MPFPAFVPTRTVTIGSAYQLESGAELVLSATVQASRSLRWRDGGFRFPSIIRDIPASQAGGQLSFELPRTDVTGAWIDDIFNALIVLPSAGAYTHRYTLTLTYRTAAGRDIGLPPVTVGPFVVPAGDEPMDLDTALQVGTVQGDMVLIPNTWDSLLAAAVAAAQQSAAALASATARFSPGGTLTAWAELLPQWVTGHSWVGGNSSATLNARWFERIAARLRMGATTNRGASGRTVGDISMITLGGPNAWTVRTKALVQLACTINDITNFGTGPAAQTAYREAWRSILSRITANGVAAANSAAFAYSTDWSRVSVPTAGPSGQTNGAHVSSTGGEQFRTTTVGAYANIAITGDAADLVFIHPASGGGLITIKNGSTTLGTLDLTGAIPQDVPATFAIRGLGPGDRTITATLTSGASMRIDSYNVPSTAPPPTVVIVEGYITDTAPLTQAAYTTAQDTYRALLAAIVADYPSARLVNASSTINGQSWDPATMLFDGKHPNDKGSAHVANLVQTALEAVGFSAGANVTTAADYPLVYSAPTAPVPVGGQSGQAALEWAATFSGADGTTPLPNTEIGNKAWKSPSGTAFRIAAGTMQPQTVTIGSAEPHAVVTSSSADGTITATVVSGTVSAGIKFRSNSAATTGYLFFRGTGSSATYTLSKQTAVGSYTSLASTSVVGAANDVLKVVMIGSQVRCYVNGSKVIDITDSSFTGVDHGGWILTTAGKMDDISFTTAIAT